MYDCYPITTAHNLPHSNFQTLLLIHNSLNASTFEQSFLLKTTSDKAVIFADGLGEHILLWIFIHIK